MVEIELGNMRSREQAEKICSVLQGRTFLNFIVIYGAMAGNYPVTVRTEDKDATEDELKDMVLSVLASSL